MSDGRIQNPTGYPPFRGHLFFGTGKLERREGKREEKEGNEGRRERGKAAREGGKEGRGKVNGMMWEETKRDKEGKKG